MPWAYMERKKRKTNFIQFLYDNPLFDSNIHGIRYRSECMAQERCFKWKVTLLLSELTHYVMTQSLHQLIEWIRLDATFYILSISTMFPRNKKAKRKIERRISMVEMSMVRDANIRWTILCWFLCQNKQMNVKNKYPISLDSHFCRSFSPFLYLSIFPILLFSLVRFYLTLICVLYKRIESNQSSHL